MLWQALTLSLGYNATLVTLGAAVLGLAAGAVGAAMVLRGRALVPDALAHATLPGLAGAFLALTALGADPRNLPLLLVGGGIGAALGLAALRALTARTRLTEDTATAAVLSVAYGGGLVLLTVIQALPGGRAAGLEGFLLGSTAGMLRQDALVIGGAAMVVLLALALCWRPLTLMAFDPMQARAMGLRTAAWDAVLAILVLAVVLVGLRVAGAILIVALLVTPAVAARLVVSRAGGMAALSALIGGACGWFGAAASAAAPGLPTGAVIVLAAFAALAAAALVRGGRAWTAPS
ncbi:MAG TPA: metal ABC transporter permease [Paracoccaceae bacterium]|nr:metal ABC transporter permease [Paracoccaceae bacterium]